MKSRSFVLLIVLLYGGFASATLHEEKSPRAADITSAAYKVLLQTPMKCSDENDLSSIHVMNTSFKPDTISFITQPRVFMDSDGPHPILIFSEQVFFVHIMTRLDTDASGSKILSLEVTKSSPEKVNHGSITQPDFRKEDVVFEHQACVPL